MKFYFPPAGFGLWYQLGILHTIEKKYKDYHLYGGSAGSIICILSILKPNDSTFDKISKISDKIRKTFFNLNYYYYLDLFIKEVYKVINNYNIEYIQEKLKKIFIEVSEIDISMKFNFFKRKFVNPKNLNELRNLCIASCYLPFLFNCKNPIYYKIDNKKYCDGFFSNFSNVDESFIKINSYDYATIVPRTNKYFYYNYTLGKKYNFDQLNYNCSTFTFVKMTISIIKDLLCLVTYDIIFK